MKTPSPRVSERGLQYFDPVESEYGGEIKVHTSSCTDYPAIWMTILSPVELCCPGGPMKEATMHFTTKNARLLAQQLNYLVKNHHLR